MRVAVIGAGASGLTSARQLSGQGTECDVFEGSSEIGGIWVYNEQIGNDQYGFPIHTVMYQDLRINLPKEIMAFADFPMPAQDESFVTQEEVLKFLNLYADHFNLRRFIQLNTIVTEVKLIQGDKWQVKSLCKPTKKETVSIYDFVMVCCGHYTAPNIAKIPGEENFKGKIMHSCHYRKRDDFKDLQVLVVGSGYSGLDVAFQVMTVVSKVVICRQPGKKEINLPPDSPIIQKSHILSVQDDGKIEFDDGSCHDFDVIVYCTGYIYSYPFLHESCGIKVEDNHVQPLYKHVVNIEHPTMCLIGLPFYVAVFYMTELQVKFYCQYINGSIEFPAKEIMYKDLEEDVRKRREKGLLSRHMHSLGVMQQEYFDDLAQTANIRSIPEVLSKIWAENTQTLHNDFTGFRSYKYKVVNDRTFTKTK